VCVYIYIYIYSLSLSLYGPFPQYPQDTDGRARPVYRAAEASAILATVLQELDGGFTLAAVGLTPNPLLANIHRMSRTASG